MTLTPKPLDHKCFRRFPFLNDSCELPKSLYCHAACLIACCALMCSTPTDHRKRAQPTNTNGPRAAQRSRSHVEEQQTCTQDPPEAYGANADKRRCVATDTAATPGAGRRPLTLRSWSALALDRPWPGRVHNAARCGARPPGLCRGGPYASDVDNASGAPTPSSVARAAFAIQAGVYAGALATTTPSLRSLVGRAVGL